jgi:predicted ATP-dependent serine protease
MEVLSSRGSKDKVLKYFNDITKGGVEPKTLNIILAGTGVGKSLAMCHMAAANLSMGRNVLYITLELSEEKVSERIDANLMNITLDDLKLLPLDLYTKRIQKIQNQTKGKLIVKEYPTASASVIHFRALLNELALKKNFHPDIIYIDYLNICTSSRIKARDSGSTYSLIKAIAEELRGLAVEFNLPIWSATQVWKIPQNHLDYQRQQTSWLH